MSRGVWLMALALLLPGWLSAEPREGLGDVTEVRHWSYDDYTRVVIELTQPVEIKTDVQRLAPDPNHERPERIYLDVADVWVGRRFDARIEVSDGLLHGVRIGQNTKTDVRVVIDLERYERHRVLTLTHPDRLVVDIYGARAGDETRAMLGHDANSDAPRPAPGIRPIQTVVLDPGHGGRDPGAIGVGGLQEKDVTLRMATAVAAGLKQRGFNVVLTREDDRALSLEERTAIAEAARGDLFISLHANAARRKAVRGVETYYLDENHERHSLTVAARENGIARSDVNALQSTLAKLRVSEVSPHARRLAETIQQQIVSGMPKKFAPVPDLGAKKGPFYVLFLSSMPAVLVEAGFLTNAEEAKRLRNEAYVGAMARQIAEALARYRAETAQVTLGRSK